MGKAYFMVGAILVAGTGSVTGQPGRRAEPLSYYSKAGPIGEVFRIFKDDPRLKKVGVIGLGTGALAGYSEPGQNWTFYEIDEDTKKIAEDPKRFTFLRDARGKVRIVLGDGRLKLQESRGTFGLLVIDPFTSSKAIPVHLWTREAVALYRQRLTPDGILVFHLSNPYVDPEPVLGKIAVEAKCVAYVRSHTPSETEKRQGIKHSRWLVMVRQKADIAPLLKTGSWKPAQKGDGKVWTDDYSNLKKRKN